MPFFSSKKKPKAQVANPSFSKQSTKDHVLIQQEMSQRQLKKPVIPGQPPYKRIDSNIWQIPLLKVLRGRSEQPIKCTTQTKLILQDKTPYETVSYCWGVSSKQKVIEVDGLRVLVTQSAEQLLRRVRLRDRDRIIWIDAICIDQDDENEKGRQVGFMSATYACAERNVIWLGPDGGSAALVQATVNAILADVYKHTDGFARLYDLTHTRGTHPRLQHDGRLLNQSIDLRPLKQLFSLPWFSRLWVVQEAALARKNLCHFGSATFALTDILKVALWVSWNSCMVRDQDLIRIPGLLSAANMWYLVDHPCVPRVVARKATDTLVQIWELLQDYDVSNPRDKIYALLGLYRRWDVRDRRPPIVPKYEKSISDMDVFKEATRAMIHDSRSLEVLQSLRPIANDASSSHRHSWTVDFSRKRDRALRPLRLEGRFQTDGGVGLQATTMAPNGDENVLVLCGVLCDQIAARTAVIQPWTSQAGSRNLGEMWPLIEQLQQRFPSRDLMSEMVLTLMGGVDQAGGHPTNDLIKKAASFLERLRRQQGKSNAFGREDRSISSFLDAMEKASVGRHFITTDNGLLGLGPPRAEVGNHVSVLYGGIVPFVLQSSRASRGSTKNEFYIVGEGYVHGIMFGEAMRWHNAARRRDEVLHIV